MEGVRTRFPCGEQQGKLADRYTRYDAVPLLRRVGFHATQCGSAGYWYVDADASARLRDAVDTTTGQIVQVVDNVRQGAEDLLSGAGKWVALAAAAYVAVQFLGRRR